jgi:hypothetical protein
VYAPGTAQRILSERDNAKHPDRMRHYMETYRANTLDPPPFGLTHSRHREILPG